MQSNANNYNNNVIIYYNNNYNNTYNINNIKILNKNINFDNNNIFDIFFIFKSPFLGLRFVYFLHIGPYKV